MNAFAIVCCVMILAHVATIAAVMFNMSKITKEFKQIVLEREETHRSLYAVGPDIETDASQNQNVMEYM